MRTYGARSINQTLHRRLFQPSHTSVAYRFCANKAPQLPELPLYAHTWVKAVEKHGSRPAVIFDGLTPAPATTITFNELESKVNRLSRALQSKYDILPGDRIVTVMENRPELMTLMLACQKVGAAFVPLASDLSQKDCRTVVNMYEPKLLFTDRAHHTKFPRPDGQGEWPTVVMQTYHEGESELMRMESAGSDEPVEIVANRSDPGIIFSTSGSTGLPKGVVYGNNVVAMMGLYPMMCKAKGLPPLWSLQPGDSSLFWVPIRGVGATLLAMMMLPDGINMVMVDSRSGGMSDAEDWAHLIDKYEVKNMILFGAAMNQFLQKYPTRSFPSISEALYGGSCFPPTLVQKSMVQFPNAIFKQAYAMTECFPISELGPEHHKLAGEATTRDLQIMSSAGKCTPLGKHFIEDMDNEMSGQPPPPEKKGVGQICASSPFMMKEYYNNPEKTKEAIGPDGLMRTGDVGKFDEEGFLHVVGRVKEIIPTHRGFNVAPRDLEEVMYQHEDVGQAAVIGIAHPSGTGELVVAWVTPKEGVTGLTAEILKQHCIDMDMPAWQQPELIQISAEQLPVVGGKIAKKVLQTPTFVIMKLADSVEIALAKAKASDDWFLLAREVFERIDGNNDGSLDIAELRAVFKEKAETMLQYFDRPDDGNELVDLGEWLAGVGKMTQDERVAWLTQASSVLAVFERQATAV